MGLITAPYHNQVRQIELVHYFLTQLSINQERKTPIDATLCVWEGGKMGCICNCLKNFALHSTGVALKPLEY